MTLSFVVVHFAEPAGCAVALLDDAPQYRRNHARTATYQRQACEAVIVRYATPKGLTCEAARAEAARLNKEAEDRLKPLETSPISGDSAKHDCYIENAK